MWAPTALATSGSGRGNVMSAVLTYDVRGGRLTAVAGGKILHLPTHNDPSRVASWEKVQELRSGKVTLWDHCFERPHQPVAGGAQAPIVIQRVSRGPASP